MAQILHGTWLPAQQKFFVWGETLSPSRRKGRQPTPPPHPFQCSPALLKEILSHATAGALAGWREQTLTVWLPSVEQTPFPSPELIDQGAVTPSAGTITLGAWQVTGLLAPAPAALDVLLALSNAKGMGATIETWRVAAQLALEMVAGQQVLPALTREGVHLRAIWRPRPTPAMAHKLTTLAQSLPPVCRAVVDDPANAPPPAALLEDFLTATVDTVIREMAVEPKLLPSTLGGKWLAALLGPDPLVNVKGRDADGLYKSWQAWSGQAQVAGDTVFRVTFRLEPPPDDPKPWTLAYLLQATDDPSLLVPAASVWRETGDEFTYLERRFVHPQERLLTALGYASRLFPPLITSLRTATPDHADLSTAEAFTFLKEAAPLLENSGFGVLVPGWWKGKRGRLQARARVKSAPTDTSGRLSFETLVNFEWEVTLGDEKISPEEFARLANLKMPLVQVRGQWVVLDPEHLRAAYKYFEKRQGQMTLGDALYQGLDSGGEETPEGVEMSGVAVDGWLQELLDRLRDAQKLDVLPPPGALRGQLRPYQARGYSWLAFMRQFGLGACLADDMGLGKCLANDTLVLVNGAPRRADELWATYAGDTEFDGEGFWASPTEPLQVNSLDEETGRLVEAPIRRLYRQAVREPLRKVYLEDGSSITTTRRHQLLTEHGWDRELKVGDYICVPSQLIWEGQPVDSDLVELIAWQLAEGYELSNPSRLTITQKDPERLKILFQTIHQIALRYRVAINQPAIRYPKDGKAPYIALTSKAYENFLIEKGYAWGKRSNEKVIPSFIMQADREGIRLFLRNFFDAEASVVRSMRSIEISTASALLIQQLSVLLRRFGIWMRISTKQKRATNGTGIFREYHLGVIGGNSVRRFLQEIGFGNRDKQGRLEEICQQHNNTNVEGIPASNLVAKLVETTKLPLRHFGMHNTVYIKGTQQFSKASLERVIAGIDRILSGEAKQEYIQRKGSKWTVQTLDAYADLDVERLIDTRQRLGHLLDQQVYYCRIKAIEDIAYDGWVYDFEVDRHHNFIANNILCHNTIQTIALLLHEREQNKDSQPALLVCPTSVVGNWVRELERFAPSLKVMVHRGAGRLQNEAFVETAQQHDIVLTSFPLLARDRETLTTLPWSTVALDEAQNIKNSSTKQAQAARALQAETRLALTGTPVENRLSELWSIMAYLNPGYLGSEETFRQRFARPIERMRDTQATERLRRLTAPFILRRLKTDKAIINDLPDKLEMKTYCPLVKEQATLYEAVVQDALRQVEEAETPMERRGLVLAMLMKLKQVCNHPRQFLKDGSEIAGRSGKLARLTEMLEEVYAAGDRALVFTQFAEMGHLLQEYLGQTFYDDILFLHGGTPAKERDEMVRRFQAPQGPTVFILSLKAGGTGLNLTRANHVFHYDRWWNPAVENQATDRAFRIGQTQRVQVHKYICGGTLEDHIDEMIESKRALAESILGAGESWLTELSTDQLRDLVTLRRAEIVDEEGK